MKFRPIWVVQWIDAQGFIRALRYFDKVAAAEKHKMLLSKGCVDVRITEHHDDGS